MLIPGGAGAGGRSGVPATRGAGRAAEPPAVDSPTEVADAGGWSRRRPTRRAGRPGSAAAARAGCG